MNVPIGIGTFPRHFIEYTLWGGGGGGSGGSSPCMGPGVKPCSKKWFKDISKGYNEPSRHATKHN